MNIPGLMWIADEHGDNGKRFVVHADEKLTAFLELESPYHSRSRPNLCPSMEQAR
jgi:hypothetical protein